MEKIPGVKTISVIGLTEMSQINSPDKGDYDDQYDETSSYQSDLAGSDSPNKSEGSNWTIWIIVIVILVVFIGICLAIWLWKSNKTNDSSNNNKVDASTSATSGNNPIINNPGNPSIIPVDNMGKPSSGSGIFGPNIPGDSNSTDSSSGSDIKVSVSGFVQNNLKTKSWFYGKTMDLSPPVKGYLIATISGKKYVLTFKRIKDGAGKLAWGMCLTDYGKIGSEDNSAIVYRGCGIIWNYRTVENNQKIESYLLARNNPLSGAFEYANVVVNQEGLPVYLDSIVDPSEYTPIVLMAEMDENKRLLGYYLVNMNGDPLCFTQEDKHSSSSQIQIGMINPTVYTGQYSKLLVRFDLEDFTGNPVNYPKTYYNRIDRRNPIKINNLWTSNWMTNASIKPYKVESSDLKPILLIRMNNRDYSLGVDLPGSLTEKIIKYLYLCPIDYSSVPIYILADSVRIKMKVSQGLSQTEIYQSTTGILHLDTEQPNPQENTLQIFEDVSAQVTHRFVFLGKAQTPLLLVNGSGFEDSEKGGVSIGVRFWNPDFYTKQRRLILRSKMRSSKIDWAYHWMKCTRCSDVFDFWYNLDDGSSFLDESKAGRCPNSRNGWQNDYGYGHLERHSDYNYLISRGSTGWARCEYCHCLCSTEMNGFCYKAESKEVIPHFFKEGYDLMLELYESEMGEGRSRGWYLCRKCGVIYSTDGNPKVCAVDGGAHEATQRYVLRQQFGDKWDQ